MGRRKNGDHSSSTLNGLPQPQGSKIRFEDDDEALIEETTESSNIDESMCEADDSNRVIEDSACEPAQSLDDKDDKTSADYYFDSYSHFGNGFSYRFADVWMFSSSLFRIYHLVWFTVGSRFYHYCILEYSLGTSP